MKLILGFLFSVSLLFAASERLVIDANNFEGDDAKGISIFTGNVKVKKAKDRLNSDRLEVYMTKAGQGKARQPLKYIAIGNADFEVFTNGKHYKGKGNKVIYDPNKLEYTVIGKGYLNEITEGRELFGEKIFIDQTTGSARVSGTKEKPVRFIINIESKEETKK